MKDAQILIYEKNTKLLESQEGVNCLQNFYNIFSRRPERYTVYLYIMDKGVDAVGQTIKYTDRKGNITSVRISNNHFQKVYNLAQKKEFEQIKKNTPAGKKGAFDSYGTEGVLCALETQRLDSSPFTGSEQDSPSLVEYALNKIHPKFVETMETYLTAIKTKAYLALPAMAFGSIGSVVSFLNGVVNGFQRIIFSVYQGCVAIIQKLYSYLNGIVAKIQKELINIIEQIIPLDLICLILDAVQSILDDINFFTSIFGQTGSIFKYLNTIQDYVNLASTWISNPFTTALEYLPDNVREIIDTIEQIGTDPGGYMTDQLTNYGYAYVAQAIQGNIYGALISKYGAQYAALGPVVQKLATAGSYMSSGQVNNPEPSCINQNFFNSTGQKVDGNLNRENPKTVTDSDFGLGSSIGGSLADSAASSLIN